MLTIDKDNTIYHITSIAEWQVALVNGVYTAPSLETEGFIHCSEEGQVEGVLERFFKDRTELMCLYIDKRLLTSPLEYEAAPSVGELFPHVYGVINLDAILLAEPI